MLSALLFSALLYSTRLSNALSQLKSIPTIKSQLKETNQKSSYKIGDSFIALPLPEVQALLSTSTTRIENEVSAIEEKLATIRDEMGQLKVALYARFGRSINLET